MQITIDANHPSLPGHFPGNPVVPGVVLLNYVFASLCANASDISIAGIRRIKFLRQVLPGQTLRLELGPVQPGKIAFKCWLGDDLAVDGQLALAA